MKSWLAMAAAAMVPVAAATVGAFEDKPPTIKSVMAKLHKGSQAEFAVLKAQAAAPTPDWAAIAKTTRDFVILGAALGKNDPPKGDKASWNQQADKYFQNSKALDDAAMAKDLAALKAAQKSMGESCKSCHSAHRGK